MLRTNRTLLVGLLFALFCLSGCGGPKSKCTKAFDNATELSLSTLDGLAGLAALGGDEAKAHAAEARTKMKTAIESKKPQAVEACVNAIKDDPKAAEAVVCVGEAKAIADLKKCSGADFIKSVL